MTRNAAKSSKRDKPETSSPQETQKKDQGVTITVITQIAAIVVAIVGCIATISVALLDSPLIPRLFPLTPTQAVESPTFTQVPTVFPTDTPFFTATSQPTSMPTFTPAEQLPTASPSPTVEMAASRLVAILTPSIEEGKSPLPVNFNARGSYIQFADGSVATCGATNFCTFTWAIYRDQKRELAPFQGQGTFSYTFSGKGIYSVTVYVCRADICADDGVVVTVK